MAFIPLIAACSGGPLAGQAEGRGGGGRGGGRGGEEGPVPVVVAPVQVKSMPVVVNAVGTVQPISTVEIHAQVTGQLKEILFTPGDYVRKGQPLFVLDARPFEAALKQAQAVVARDEAQVNDARTQRDRAQNLFQRGLIPRNELDTQSAGAAALEATLAADQAQVEQAELNLRYTRISAPMEGRTGDLTAHVGDLVRANDTTPLVTINQLAPIDVAFAVPGRLLADVQRYYRRGPLRVRVTGQPATLPGEHASGAAPRPSPSDTGEGAALAPPRRVAAEGKVTFIDNAVDPATSTIKLKATFPNTDHALWPGLFVQVALQLADQPNAVVVPSLAVQTSQQGQYVYVVTDQDTVEMREVTVDREQGDATIIASGLRQGERVVTEGQLRLTPGVKITATAGVAAS